MTPRVVMTAISVFPLFGVAGKVSASELLAVVLDEAATDLPVTKPDAPALCTKTADKMQNDTNIVSTGLIVRIAYTLFIYASMTLISNAAFNILIVISSINYCLW
jgi:hypothetical protein